MKLTQLVAEIGTRCAGMDQARSLALLDDLRACGFKDGPSLQVAFDLWRTEWPRRTAPTAAEFNAIASKATDGNADQGPPFNTRDRVLWAKAWKHIRHLAGWAGMDPEWDAGHPRADAAALNYLDVHAGIFRFRHPHEAEYLDAALAAESSTALTAPVREEAVPEVVG